MLNNDKMASFEDFVSSIKRAPVEHVKNLITLGGIPQNPLGENGEKVWAPLLTILMRRDIGKSKENNEHDILSITKMLVENGEDVREQNVWGKTPIDLARQKGLETVVDYLHGVMLNA